MAPQEPPGGSRVHLRDGLARLRWAHSSLRSRIVAWFMAALALSTVCFVAVTYGVLAIRLDQRIDAELRQEAAELRMLAHSTDPATGRPFASVRRIFDVYLLRNVPSRNEAHMTFLRGKPYLRSAQVVPDRLDGDPELVARWGKLRESDRSRVSTPAGRVEYLPVPLTNGAETGSSSLRSFAIARCASPSRRR